MEFHPGRMLGIVLGIVILATIFLAPFGTTDTHTLYGVVSPEVSNLGAVQAQGQNYATYAYIFIVAFILLVIAGVVGLFPLGTGVMGVVGMALITVAPYLVFPNGPVKLDPGIGFYVIWVASIAALGASFWHGKKQAGGTTNVTVTQTQTMAAPAQQVRCPNCGSMNPMGSVKCASCGKSL